MLTCLTLDTHISWKWWSESSFQFSPSNDAVYFYCLMIACLTKNANSWLILFSNLASMIWLYNLWRSRRNRLVVGSPFSLFQFPLKFITLWLKWVGCGINSNHNFLIQKCTLFFNNTGNYFTLTYIRKGNSIPSQSYSASETPVRCKASYIGCSIDLSDKEN